MADTNTAFVKGRNVITAKGRILWPSLFEPTKMRGQDDAKLKYQVTIMFPSNVNLDALKDAAKEAASEKFGSKLPSSLRSPFRKTDENDRLEEMAEEYPVYITGRSKDRPGLVGPSGKAVDDPEQVYSGRWARISVQAFGYDQAGNKGVSFGLQNVQLLDHDDALDVGGARVAAESEFDAVEGAGDGETSSEDLFG